VKKPEIKAVDEIEMNLSGAIALKPEARVKWLTRAVEMAKEGKASSRELFDIISNRKFTSGVPFKIGRRIYCIADECASLFSERQQRYMQSSEWILHAKYGGEKDDVRDQEDKGLEDTNNSQLGGESPKTHASRDDEEDERSSRRRVYEERPRKSEDELEKREALERRLAAEEQERRLKREERKRQAINDEMEDFTSRFLQKKATNRQQVEDEVDSSLRMLEKLKQPEGDASPPRRKRRRRQHDSRSPHNQQAATSRRGSKRRRSRSGSISVQAATPSASPSPRRNNHRNDRRGGGGGGESFEDALRRRMAQRDANDSTRIPVTWTREDMRRGRHLENRSKWAAGGKPIS